MAKVGRNDFCPCGSRKKYKKCCINKEDDPNFRNPENFLANYKSLKKQSKIKQCLHPDKNRCSEKVIGAHSIQNNEILKRIADDGMLYMPYPKVDNPFEIATKWGRKEATVFTGFCGYHDNELFKPIENYDFDYSDRHMFLYTYRAFALCYQRKQENIKYVQGIFSKTPSIINLSEFEDIFKGDKLAINDLEKPKVIFEKAILKDEYDVLTSVVWKFEKVINFAASGFTVLTKDLKGRAIQDLMNFNVQMKHVFFTVFPEGDNSYCILSWLKEENDIFEEYRKQLLELTEAERKTYLNNLIPMESENIVIKPSSWDAMDKQQQEEFGMLIWNFGQLYEMMSEEPYNMLEEKSFNLFEL
jgi:hypothetical protein